MPKFQPQLTGISSESADCGVRTMQMLIDWSTRGAKIPGVRGLRRRMGFEDPKAAKPTSPADWHRAVQSFDSPAELGGLYEYIEGEPLTGGNWSRIENHLIDGKMVGLAIDYKTWNKIAPRKSGSDTYMGLHAVALKGPIDDRGRVKDFDPLFDGRRPGIPNGPVWVGIAKLEKAARAAGEVAAGNSNSIYGYLMDRAVRIGGGVVLPEPDEPASLSSIRSDLMELLDKLADIESTPISTPGELVHRIWSMIDDIDAIIGPYTGDVEPDEEPESGVAINP